MSIELIGSYASIISLLVFFLSVIKSHVNKIKKQKIEHLNETKEVRQAIKNLMSLTTSAAKKNDITVYIQALLADYRHSELKMRNETDSLTIIWLILSIVGFYQVFLNHYFTGKWSLFSWGFVGLEVFGIYTLFSTYSLLKEAATITKTISFEYINSLESNVNKIQSQNTSTHVPTLLSGNVD